MICTAIFSVNVQAQSDIFAAENWSLSGNLTLASDYRWRGISMNKNKPAVQGGLRLKHSSGAYAGVWASNTDLGNGASIEADWMLGYRHALNDHSAVTLQYIDIHYPGSDVDFKTDFSEFSIAYQYTSWLKEHDAINASMAYSDHYYAGSGKMYRFDARYDYPIYSSFGLFVAGGMTQLKDQDAFFKVWGNNTKDHYYDWKVGVSSNLFGLWSELYYADNSTVNPDIDSMNGRLIFSLTKVF